MSWADKVVLITGASSGIGRGLALALANRGAKLGLVARRKNLLDELATKIGPENVSVVTADVQAAESMRVAAQETVAKFAEVINVNLLGAANSVAAVLPQMLERGAGQLAIISSLAAYRGLPKSAGYCASKAAVSAFFESLRLDLQPRGIDVTIVHPGFIKTPLTAGRTARLPFLMELDDAVPRIIWAIEKRKKSYAFPWQLATIVRAGMIMPNFMYDWIVRRNSFRE